MDGLISLFAAKLLVQGYSDTRNEANSQEFFGCILSVKVFFYLIKSASPFEMVT